MKWTIGQRLKSPQRSDLGSFFHLVLSVVCLLEMISRIIRNLESPLMGVSRACLIWPLNIQTQSKICHLSQEVQQSLFFLCFPVWGWQTHPMIQPSSKWDHSHLKPLSLVLSIFLCPQWKPVDIPLQILRTEKDDTEISKAWSAWQEYAPHEKRWKILKILFMF